MSADAVSVPPATSGKSSKAASSSPTPPPIVTLLPGRYWLGLKEGQAPRETIHLGGIAFSRTTYTDRSTSDGDGTKTYDIPRDGDYLDLYEDDIARLRAARGRKVARFVSANSGIWRIYDKGTLGYRPMKGDVPLEDFVLLRRLRDHDAEGRDVEGRHGGTPVCLKDVA